MAEDFHVTPPAIVNLGVAISGQQQGFHGLCGPAQQCASAIDTGDAALDEETRSLIDMINSMLRKAGDGLAQTGTILAEIAEDYVASDEQGAQDMKPLGAELSEGAAEIPSVKPPVDVDVPAV